MPTEVMSEEELKTQALTVAERAKIVKIENQQTYDAACSLLLDVIKPLRKATKEFFDSMKEPAYRAYKAVLDNYSEADGPLEAAERQVKAALAVWTTEQERLRQELQRQADAEARRREEEQRQNAAAVAEETGATEEEVTAIIETPVLAITSPVAPTFERAKGVSSRDNYKAKVTDLKALCRAVGAGKVSAEYVMGLTKDKDTGIISSPALNGRANSDKLTLAIPGVAVYNQPIIAGRGR
jgi:hypothetical protein